MPTPRKDRPLRVRIVDGVLTIEVGVDTLAFAAVRSDYAYARSSPGEQPDVTIVDRRLFARDVAIALHDEAEDGSSILTRMLDDATERAMEQGSAAVFERDEIKSKKRRRA